jgi:hypothetical protein
MQNEWHFILQQHLGRAIKRIPWEVSGIASDKFDLNALVDTKIF